MRKKTIAGTRTAKPGTERKTMIAAAEALLLDTDAETPSAQEGVPAKDKPPKDPFHLAAEIMVTLTFEDHPDLREAARREGAVIAVEVPQIWLEQVADAFGQAVWGDDFNPIDGDDEIGTTHIQNPKSPEHTARWCEFRRYGTTKQDRAHGNRSLSRVLTKGLPVYGFAPVPKESLPGDFMRVCERHVVIRGFDATVVGKVIEAMFDKPPSKPFPEELADLVTEGDMMLARRPRQTVDEYVSLLATLAKQRAEPAAPVKPTAALTLDNIAGMHEAVEWGRQLAQDIEDFRAGRIAWHDVDPGVLLVGPPGTGKTTFARAVAGTCGVAFVSGSLGEWQAAGHLGDLLKAMRAAFKRARDTAPCILFIDEIDAFGARASFEGNNKDYSVQVVNALLELLEGVQGREGVVVVAACNNPDNLDPAMVRSGRLDRTIYVPLPDVADLERMFRIHLNGELADFDLMDAASKAEGRTGADVKRWVRGARRQARTARREMVIEDLLTQIERVAPVPTASQLRRAAVHEAGHCVVIALDRPGDLVAVTIRQTANTGGSTASRVASDLIEMTPMAIRTALRRLLSGRAAEEVVLGSPSGGSGGSPGSDLARATLLAVSSLASLGLAGEDSLGWMGDITEENLSQFLAMHPVVARQAQGMLASAYASVVGTLQPRTALLRQIADLLVERETMDGEEIEALVKDFEIARSTNSASLDSTNEGPVP